MGLGHYLWPPEVLKDAALTNLGELEYIGTPQGRIFHLEERMRMSYHEPTYAI